MPFVPDAIAEPTRTGRFVPDADAAPRQGSGVWDAMVSGVQGSATGMMVRGRLPDVQIDRQHSKWYEEALGGLAGAATDLPLMIGSGMVGAAGGGAVGGPVGAVLGGGAMGMAVPREIRESLTRAYQSGEADSSADFLTRAGIILKGLGNADVMKLTALDATIGAATMGTGALVSRGVGAAIAPMIGDTLSIPAATRIIGGSGTAAEVGAITVAPAALEGRLPEMRDFANAAVVVGGLKAAPVVAGKLTQIYARTGRTPEQVVADARTDATIAADLGVGAIAVARKNNTFVYDKNDTSQGYGSRQGFPQPSDTPVEKVFSNFADQPATESQAAEFRSGMFDRANSDVRSFKKEEVTTGDAPLSDGLTARIDASDSGTTRVQVLDGGEVIAAARIKKGMVDSIATVAEAKGRGVGEKLLRFLDDQGIANIREVPDRSPGYVKILKSILSNPSPTKATGEEIPKAYKPLAEAEMLKDALPEAPKVAEVMANPRGTITDGKEPNHINYRYSETPEDVQALRAKIAETFKTEIEEARGKESWDATQEKAGDIIANRLAGMSDDQKATFEGMKFEDLAAQSMAVEAMAQRAAFDARKAASDLVDVSKSGNEAEANAAHARLVQAIEQSALLHAIDQGNGAEIARALNSRKAAKQRGELAEAMSDTLLQYGEDPHVLARMVLGLHTTAEITAFAKAASKATTWEKIVEAWKAGILSGPVTHLANVVGNTTFMALRPIVDLTASAVGHLTGGERVSAVEPFSRIFGNLQGAKDALLEAGAALQVAYGEGGLAGLAKQIAVGKEGANKSEQFRKAIGGVAGDIVRLPFRALSLADDFFRVMNSQGEKYALATREAIKTTDLLSREFREKVVDLVQNDADIAKAGAVAGERLTFNTALGEKGQAVQNLVKKANLQLLVPFIRTPANIFKEMLRMTPLAPIIGEWSAAYKAGGAERAKAVAEVMMGTAISGVVASYVLDGNLSGQGNPDPNKRRAAVAAGWQPYSVKIGNKWYSYQRLQPVGTLMGMAADLMEVYENVTEDEGNKAATMLSVAFANAVTQQTFLQGITSIVQVLADPQRYGPRFVQQYAGSLVPAIIAQPTAMNDPIQREINGIVDAVKARIPGLRDTLEPKVNPLTGQVEGAKQRVGGASPMTTTQESEDKVLTEATRLKVGITAAPKRIEMPTGGLDAKLGKIELTPEQRTTFAETSGELVHRIMDRIVNEPRWDTTPDLIKKKIYDHVIEVSHKSGRASAVTLEQRMQKAHEIADSLRSKLAPVQ